jgi:hypothetical protein
VSNIGRPAIAAIGDWLIDGARSAEAVDCNRPIVTVPAYRSDPARSATRLLLLQTDLSGATEELLRDRTFVDLYGAFPVK